MENKLLNFHVSYQKELLEQRGQGGAQKITQLLKFCGDLF